MSDIEVYGFPVSPHVRTARMAFQEKGLKIQYREIAFDDLAGETYGKINPFRKMPALVHGAVTLFETPALLVYADALSAAPSLQPADPVERARMWQFIGIAQTQLYPIGVMQLYFQNVLASLFGLAKDDAVAGAAVAPTALALDVLEAGIKGGFIAGGALSLADLYCGVMIDYVSRTRDGRALVLARPKVATWLTALQARPSFKDTFAPMLAGSDQV